MTTAPARPRRGRPPIPRDRIIDAAIEMVEERGADALTLRSLAERLGSSTATLYRHVANRAELIGLVYDRILSDVASDQPARPTSWEEDCRRLATEFFTVLSRHHGIAMLVAQTVPTQPNALALREQLLAILTSAGFSTATAARSVATLGHYVLGFAMQAPTRPRPDEDIDAAASLRNIDSQQYPITAIASTDLPRPLEDEFAFGLELILNGLRQQLGTGRPLTSTLIRT